MLHWVIYTSGLRWKKYLYIQVRLFHLDFDELGDRGFIAGNIDEENKELKLKFIKTSAKTFAEYSLDTSEINSEEELIEKINNTQFDDNKFYKINISRQMQF